jgi:hypothetical protein
MNRSESIAKIAPAFLKAQKTMGNAIKDSKNPFFKSNYADLNAVREASMPALNENGISVLQPTVVVDGKNYVETILMHESGEFFSSFTAILCAKENDAQGNGSGISYARRYGLQSFVSLGSADDDGEGAMGRTPAKTWQKPAIGPKAVVYTANSVNNNVANTNVTVKTDVPSTPTVVTSENVPETIPQVAAKVAKLTKPSFKKAPKVVEATLGAVQAAADITSQDREWS